MLLTMWSTDGGSVDRRSHPRGKGMAVSKEGSMSGWGDGAQWVGALAAKARGPGCVASVPAEKPDMAERPLI